MLREMRDILTERYLRFHAPKLIDFLIALDDVIEGNPIGPWTTVDQIRYRYVLSMLQENSRVGSLIINLTADTAELREALPNDHRE